MTTATDPLRGKRVLLGVTGGIGAYKSAQLVRDLLRSGAEVSVVMTSSATEFITPLTMETLSGNPVGLEMFSLTEERSISHIERAAWADVMIVAPATANFLAKAAGGIADDLLSTILLATRCPLIIAPAMNTRMWEHEAVQKNLAVLRDRGAAVVEPAEGELACGEVGAGRLAELDKIVAAAGAIMGSGDLAGISIVVTGGPTREYIDDVRFLTNRSSGKMAYAIARVARSRGAAVTLVSGPVSLPEPGGVTVVGVESAGEMFEQVKDQLETSQWLVMAAAVADFTPVRKTGKIKKEKKDSLELKLDRTQDILAGVAHMKEGRLYAGFAAEMEKVEENAAGKLAGKGLDMIVANDVSRSDIGFGSDDNAAVILTAEGKREELPVMSKDAMAHKILDEMLEMWESR
jgi:phosphopantothenoylcysteine decarboxylase/phosphopantothenate--cysteine ligase